MGDDELADDAGVADVVFEALAALDDECWQILGHRQCHTDRSEQQKVERSAQVRFQEAVVTASEYLDRNTELLQARFARAGHQVELAQANGNVRVSVLDNGPGIAPADREQLFRPFFSGNHGTGLGLTIARELSHALGGEIELDSEPGRGSRFELILPA